MLGFHHTHNPQPTTHNPQPTTHNPQPTTHNPQPTTRRIPMDDLQHLEPGEHNPLEHEPTYNPLKYCYRIPVTIDEIDYEVAVKFQLQMHGKTTPIEFTDPKTGKQHTPNFFPRIPEVALEPEIGPEPDLDHGYQIGEAPYYLVPTVHRCKHIETGQLLTREAARHLISPEVLENAINNYREQVEADENAPIALVELLRMWDPLQQSTTWDEEDDWDEDYDWDPYYDA